MSKPFDMDAFNERCARERNYSDRATKIVDRVMPRRPTPHGFYDPQGFVENCRYNSQRKRLYWRTYARLRAKAEGGKPYITLPKNSDHLWGPGDAFYDVSKELEREAALGQ